MAMRPAICLLLVLLGNATEVHELASSMANPKAADVATGELAGRAIGNKELNMPGPRYGQPGYKESHNWENDVDIFSPTVFNEEFYAAKQGLVDKSSLEIKTDWKNALAQSTVAPNCRQANAQFSLNKYDENNPAVHATTEGDCAKLLESYLSTGVYDGLSGATSHVIKRQGQPNFAVEKTELDIDLAAKDHITPSQEYTLSFWLKLNDAMAVDGNILHFGDTEYARSPAVYAKAGTTNLKFSVSQSNEQDFHCSVDSAQDPGALEKKKWYAITLVVRMNGASVYVDGEKKSDCENPDGTTVVPKAGTHMYLSDPWTEAARAEIQKLTYYPNLKMSEAEIMAQANIEKASLK